MSTITDERGREYDLRLTVGKIRKVRERLGVNLTHLENDPLGSLANDPEAFFECLWLLCRDQFTADENAVDGDGDPIPAPVQFAESFGPDALDAASSALLEAIIAFFPHGKRSHLRSLAKTLETKREKAMTAMIQEFESEEVSEKIVTKSVRESRAALEQFLNEDFTNTRPSEGGTSATSSTEETESRHPTPSVASPLSIRVS